MAKSQRSAASIGSCRHVLPVIFAQN